MRIAYVTEGRLNSFMADTFHILQSVDALTSLGHEVVLFAREGDVRGTELAARYKLDNEPTTVLINGRDFPQPWRRITRVWNSWSVARKVRSYGHFDLVIGREIYAIMHLLRSKVPFLIEAHEMPGKFQRPILRFLLKHDFFKRLVVISSSLRDDHLMTFPQLAPNKVIVLPMAVTEAFLTEVPTPVTLPSTRSNVVQVGYLGALYPGKGMEIIIPLAKSLPEVDVHVVGGRQADLIRWRDENMPPNLHFQGQIGREQVAETIDAFDIALLPSQISIGTFSGRTIDYGIWTSPMKLLEYMARGKAIIASDLPGIRDVVGNDGTLARLVPHDNLTAWQHAVLELAREPKLRRDLGLAARDACQSRHTSIARARQMLGGL